MLELLLHWVRRMREAVSARVPAYRILREPVRADLLRMRFEIEGDGAEALAELRRRVDASAEALLRGGDGERS